MTKVVVRTDDVEGFFARAKDAARRADHGQAFEGKVTLSFEDPQRMFTVLSEARRRLILEVMQEPRTINEFNSSSASQPFSNHERYWTAGKDGVARLATSG